MDKQTDEILTILQEEAAEVIVEVSKCFRFGLSGQNLDRLEKEIGDLQLMIDLLIKQNVGISLEGLEVAKKAKSEKLKVFSSIKI
jgi:NTP pyrophosphatase (non-canonical NTP hydrolase)